MTTGAPAFVPNAFAHGRRRVFVTTAFIKIHPRVFVEG